LFIKGEPAQVATEGYVVVERAQLGVQLSSFNNRARMPS
jgi:hypothetical protein